MGKNKAQRERHQDSYLIASSSTWGLYSVHWRL